MKKITSAAVAATLGAALLLGGAGTLAYWSDTKTSESQTISSGNLQMDVATGQNWTIKRAAGSAAPVAFVPGTDKIVPGDVLTQTVNVPVKLVGKNIAARLTVNTPNLTGALKDDATVAVTNINGTAIAAGAASSVILGATDASSVPVTVTVTFPFGTASVNTVSSVNKSLSFSSSYLLEQVEVGTTK